MKIRWYGHTCFLLESQEGVKIIADPFDGSVGYKIPKIEADIVTVSHDHCDHNYVEAIQCDPKVIKSPGVYVQNGIRIKGLPAYHDEVKGAKRGSVIIFVYDIDGLRICHLGDLGHLLSKSQLEEIGQIDILMIPVGGTFTLDADGAQAVIEQIDPKIIIPMHYHTPAVSMPIDPVDTFLEKMGYGKNVDDNTIEITPETLGDEQQILVLNYE